jgi:hypothetical protein
MIADIDLDALARALGLELRQARKRRKLTLKDIMGRMRGPVSMSSMVSYGTGARPLTVVRFVEMCKVMGEAPGQLLDKACLRASAEFPDDAPVPAAASDDQLLFIRFAKVAESRDPVLHPFASWAKKVAGFGPANVSTMDLDTARAMACVCGVDLPQLVELLRAADALIGVEDGASSS